MTHRKQGRAEIGGEWVSLFAKAVIIVVAYRLKLA